MRHTGIEVASFRHHHDVSGWIGILRFAPAFLVLVPTIFCAEKEMNIAIAKPTATELASLGGQFLSMGRPAEAKSYCTKALEQSPTNVVALKCLADVLRAEERGADAARTK